MMRLLSLYASVLACLVAGSAGAQTGPTVQDATVDDLVELLSSPRATTKGFRPTRKPDADGLCDQQMAFSSSGSKTLVVEYADDSAPRAELSISFGLNSDRLLDEGVRLLDKLALALNTPGLRDSRFAVAGHTDVSGSKDHNLRLSCARALSARRHLIGKGVSADRLTAYGFGSFYLLPGHAETSELHRRVEVRRAPH